MVRAFNRHDLFGRAIQELVTGPPKLYISSSSSTLFTTIDPIPDKGIRRFISFT